LRVARTVNAPWVFSRGGAQASATESSLKIVTGKPALPHAIKDTEEKDKKENKNVGGGKKRYEGEKSRPVYGYPTKGAPAGTSLQGRARSQGVSGGCRREREGEGWTQKRVTSLFANSEIRCQPPPGSRSLTEADLVKILSWRGVEGLPWLSLVVLCPTCAIPCGEDRKSARCREDRLTGEDAGTKHTKLVPRDDRRRARGRGARGENTRSTRRGKRAFLISMGDRGCREGGSNGGAIGG